MRGKRLLVLTKGSPLVGGLKRAMRAADAEVIVAQDPTAASWYLADGPLHGLVLLFDRLSHAMEHFVAGIRTGRLNARIPVLAIADELDAESIRRLATLGVAGVMLSREGVDGATERIAGLVAPSSRATRYDVRLINCFLVGAREIFGFYLEPAPAVGRPSLKDGDAATGFATALIDFSAGGRFGSLAISFDHPFVDALALKLLGESDDLDAAACADLAGEMCNQVLGKAKTHFEHLGIPVSMGLPELLVGEGHLVRHKVDNPVIVVPITDGRIACVMEIVMGQGVSG